ncbi:hypothetical protein TNCV_3283481 [Trichonephila clavipes]|nr:hypothetical protein TNCV_3283481 [Trichonephila clavipes]
MPITTFEFDWEIEYVSRLLHDQKVSGPDFNISNFTGYIGFRKSFIQTKNPVSNVYLVIGNTTNKEIFLEYDVSLLNGDGYLLSSKKSDEIFVITANTEREIQILAYFSHRNYFRSVSGDKFIIRGILKMHRDIHTVAYAQEQETLPIYNPDDVFMRLKTILTTMNKSGM